MSAPRLFLALCCILLALPRPWALAQKAEGTLVLTTAHSAPRSLPDGAGYEDRIVAEACRRAGLGLRVVHQPSERALRDADQGAADGNYSRVAGLEQSYPNLVMVQEPMDAFEFTAFTRQPDMRLDSWASLKPYSVAIIAGWKILEANITGTRSLNMVRDEAALFHLLANGRADVVVVDLKLGQETIRRLGLTDIRPVLPPLALRPMHLYLNRRRADLAPKLSEALRAMKRDGTFQRLIREAQETAQ